MKGGVEGEVGKVGETGGGNVVDIRANYERKSRGNEERGSR